MSDLDNMLPKMGLDDDQEASITNRLDQTFLETSGCMDVASELKDSLTEVVRLLSYIVEQQNKLVINANISEAAEANTIDMDDEQDLQGNVELF